MGKILAFSGKKQAGKNTSTNYLVGCIMVASEIISHCGMTDRGELTVPFDPEEEGKEPIINILDPLSRNEEMRMWFSENLWHMVKVYSFADKLKEFAIDCLGLTDAQCYGTDADKDSIVPHLLWENMPGITQYIYQDNEGNNIDIPGLRVHENGPMTAREVLQFFGTDIGRRMYNDIWVHATISQIKKDDPLLAIICDCRFPNEVHGVQSEGGKVIRLTRNINNSDQHFSELALDPANFDQSKFDFILDNSTMTIAQQNDAVGAKMIEWGWFEPKESTIIEVAQAK